MSNPLLMFTPDKYEELEQATEQQAPQLPQAQPEAGDAENPLLMFDDSGAASRDPSAINIPSTAYTRALGLPTSAKVPGWVPTVMRNLMRSESAMVKPLLDVQQTTQEIQQDHAESGLHPYLYPYQEPGRLWDYTKRFASSVGRVPRRMYEGFVEDEPHSYYELLDAMFPDAPDWTKVIGSLPLSMYGDPLAYMTFFRRAAEGQRVVMQLGGRTVIRGERLINAMENLVDSTKNTPIGRELMQKFSRNVGPEGYAAFRDDFINLMEYRIGKHQEQGMSFYEAVGKVSEETGLSRGEISQLWERPVVTRTDTRQITEQVPVDRRVVNRAVGGEDLPAGPPPGEVLRESVRKLDLPTEPTVYKVRRGDTLSEIAERHFVTVDELLEANPNIADPNRIRANQNVNVPVPSHMRSIERQVRGLEELQEWHITEALKDLRAEIGEAQPGRRVRIDDGTYDGSWMADGSTYPEWYHDLWSTTKSKRNIERAIDNLIENPSYRERSKLADELWETAHNRLAHGSKERYYYPHDPDQSYIDLLGWQQELADDLRKAATATEREQVVRSWEQRMRTEVHKVEVPVLRQAPQEVQNLVHEMREWNEVAARRLEEAGIPVTRFEHDDIQYLAHRITPEARKIISGEGNANQWGETQVRRTMDWDIRDRHGQSRKMRDMTIQEANESFMAEHGVPLFIDDPAIATTMRMISAERAATSAEFLQGVAKNPEWAQRVSYRVKEGDTLASIAEEVGTTVEDLVARNPELGRIGPAAEGRVQTGVPELMGDLHPRQHNVDRLLVGDAPADWRRVEGKRFGDFTDEFAFHPEIAKDLEGFIRVVDPDELSTFLSMYDQYMNIWKLNALAWYPGYHTRNLVGNMLNNHAAGVKSPRVYEEALWAWRGRAGGNIELPNEVTLPDGRVTKTLTYEDLGELAARHGARGRGQYSAISDMVDEAGFGQRSLTSPVRIGDKAPSDYAFMIQEAQEDWTRMAHFLDRLKKGDTPIQASESVKKYLFDYTVHGLTEFERSHMRRLIPFYVWSRNNLPLQLELLFTQPGYIAGRGKLYRGVEGLFGGDEDGVDPRHMDDFIAGGMPIRVGGSDEGLPRYWRSQYWDPAADLSQISTGRETARFIGSMLTPPLQALIEGITGQHLYFGGDVERYPGQVDQVPGLRDVPVASRALNPLLTLAPGTRVLHEIQRTNPFRLVDPDDPRSAGERALGALGIRTYARDPETEEYWHNKEWKDGLFDMLRDYRSGDGTRTKAAKHRNIMRHLGEQDFDEWSMEDIGRLLREMGDIMRSTSYSQDHEKIRFIEDMIYEVQRRI